MSEYDINKVPAPPAAASPAIQHARLSFDRAFNVVVAFEGGYSDHPRDPGRATRFGISQRAYPQENIETITRERAAFLLFRDCWLPCRAGELPAALALVCFDSAVLDGPGTACRLMQRALYVDADGIIGPVTLAAARRTTPETIVRFLTARDRRYHALVQVNPELREFLDGWINRLFRVHREAVRLEVMN